MFFEHVFPFHLCRQMHINKLIKNCKKCLEASAMLLEDSSAKIEGRAYNKQQVNNLFLKECKNLYTLIRISMLRDGGWDK